MQGNNRSVTVPVGAYHSETDGAGANKGSRKGGRTEGSAVENGFGPQTGGGGGVRAFSS